MIVSRYPHSVSRDYLPYQIWDTIQAFCSTVTGMLAAKAMLTGIGVGSNTATVGAALWQTTVRRNIGKVARIVFVTFKQLILLYMFPRATTCVLRLLYMCPNTHTHTYTGGTHILRDFQRH